MYRTSIMINLGGYKCLTLVQFEIVIIIKLGIY